METQHVFVDTEAFVRANFQYASGPLHRLAALAKKKRITLHLTEITIQEVMAKIAENLVEIRRAAKAFRKTGRILRNSTHPFSKTVFQEFEKETIEAELVDQFNHYLQESHTNVISIANSDVNTIFRRYFGGEPPFGEGKKKHEFPDAFVLASLEKWCKKNDQKMHVVSGDSDMQSACKLSENLISLGKIEALLELVTIEDQVMPELAQKMLKEHLELIERQAIDLLTETDFWVEDYFGDVEEVVIDSVDLQEMYLWDLDTDWDDSTKEAASFELTYLIEFTAKITYEDHSYAIYDKEDDTYYGIEYVETEVKRATELPVQVRITFNRKEPYQPNLSYVALNIEYGIDVAVDDDYPYK
jgi:hypothetical protein